MKKTVLIRIITGICILFPLLSMPVSGLQNTAITCEGAYLADMATDTVLYEKNADVRMYPAGLTKIMTAILTIENATLDEMVTISEKAAERGASGGNQRFKAGEQLSVGDLLYFLLLISSNEAAYALAEHIGGDEETFVLMMNNKAAQLQAADTNFVNSSGLHDDGHYTTPRDIYRIAVYAAKNSRFMEIANSVERRVAPTNLNDRGYSFYTDNHLISQFKERGYIYPHAQGMIGGYTSKAGYCLASTAQTDKGGMRLIGIVMGGRRADSSEKIPSFLDMAKLFTEAFEGYAIVPILKTGEMLGETSIALGKTKDFISVSAGENISVLMPTGADLSKVEKNLLFNENLTAPIAKGDILGSVTLVYEGKVYATSPLYANFDVEKSEFLQFIHSISGVLRSGAVKIGAVIVVLLIVGYVLMTIVSNRRRQALLRGRMNKRKKL